jgi:hypothetical protein
MTLLAIDPGNHTGWAVFVNDQLYKCGTVTPFDWGTLEPPPFDWGTLEPPPFGFVLIEEPTIYPHSKADPANIMALQLKVGQLKQLFESRGYHVELVQPRTWKGQVPKEIHHRRVRAALTPAELARIPKSHTHDTLDAIGLGLWRTGRMKR